MKFSKRKQYRDILMFVAAGAVAGLAAGMLASSPKFRKSAADMSSAAGEYLSSASKAAERGVKEARKMGNAAERMAASKLG